jgi:hypothetical protein
MNRVFQLLLFFTLLSLSVLFSTITAQTTGRGKCVPFPTFDGLYVNGLSKPTCASLLQGSGYKPYFWARENAVPKGYPEGTNPLESQCVQETMYEYDSLSQRLVNSFSPDQPTSLCQNILLTILCLHTIPLCDPDIDTGDVYITKEKHKPCRWNCELITQQVEEFCTPEDIDYLAEMGFSLGNGVSQITPIVNFDCSNDDVYAPADSEDCVAPQFIHTAPVGARCEPYAGTICSGVFGNAPIYIPSGLTQEDIENELATASLLLSAVPIDTISSCAADATRLFCTSMFRGCSTGVKVSQRDMTTGEPIISPTTTKSTNLVMPLSTPQYICKAYVESCSDTEFFKMYSHLVYNDGPLADCINDSSYNKAVCITSKRTAVSDAGSSWLFNSQNYYGPMDYGEMIYDGSSEHVFHTATFSSKNIPSHVSHIPYTSECPPPLVLAKTDAKVRTVFGIDSAPTRCTWSCPNPIFSDHERNVVQAFSLVLVIISMIFSGILAITFTLFHSQRHKVILFWYIITFFIAIFTVFLGLVIRTDGGSLWDFQCKNDQEYTHMSGFALFQGMFIIFFFTASTCWWMMLALDIFQRLILGSVYRRGTLEFKKRHLAMHIFCWLVPALTTVACIVAHQIGYDQYLPFAFIAFDPSRSNVIPTTYNTTILFFIVHLLAIVIGFGFLTVIMIYLVRYDPTEGLKKFNEGIDKSASKWFKAQQVLKVFGFVLLVIPFITLLVVRTAIIASSSPGWTDAQNRWGEDLLLSSGGYNILTGLPVSDHPLKRVSIGFIGMSVFALASPGFMMFILYFLLSTDIMGLWAGLFYYKLGLNCCHRFAKEDTNTGSDASTDSASKGSSSQGSTGKTAGSSDLFGGSWFVLTKRGQENATQSHSDVNSGIISNPGSSAPSNGSSAPVLPHSSAPRKGQLFKGFTKASHDHKKPKSQPSIVYSASSQVTNDVELAHMASIGDEITQPEEVIVEDVEHETE